MIFENFYFYLVTLNPNILLVFLQTGRYSQGYQEEEENPVLEAFYVCMGVIVVLALLFLLISIFKDFILHFILRVPEFSILYKYNSKNLRLAYKIIGCHVVVADAGERRGQYIYLVSYLKRRFPNAGSMNLREIPSIHELYPEINDVLTWLNKHLDQEHKIQFIDFMVDLAFHNEKLSKREMGLIYHAGRVFGIPRSEVKSILTMRYKFYEDKRKREQEHRRSRRTTRRPTVNLKNQALKILGLNTTVSDFDIVKKAYRQIAKKHHPDRFHNDSQEEQQKAHERFTEINKAYEYLENALN